MTRRLLIAIFVLLLPVAAHALWDYVELRRLIGEIEAIREAGEPVFIGYEDAEPFDGPRGAGSYYGAAALLMAGARPPYGLTNEARLWLDGADGVRPPREFHEALRAAVAERPDALSLADKGALLEYRGLPYDSDYSYRAHDLGAVLRVIAARTIDRALSGDGDGAVESAITGLRMRRFLGDVAPILTREDFQTAAILSLASPSLAALERLQSTLEERDDDGRGAVEAIVRERARTIERVWRTYYGNDPRFARASVAPGGLLSGPERLRDRVLRPWLSHLLVDALRDWSEVIRGVRASWPERGEPAAARINRLTADPVRPAGLLWSAAPAVAAFRFVPPGWLRELAEPSLLTTDRASRVAVAIERFRRDHDGQLPAGLDALVPRYLPAVPLDPKTGSSLLFRTDGRSYTVYSVGQNKKDDGGVLVESRPPGAARPLAGSRDSGVRVIIR